MKNFKCSALPTFTVVYIFTEPGEYMFAALIAPTDIDFIALDKGDISPSTVVDKLIHKMEEYANFGFDYIQQRMEE